MFLGSPLFSRGRQRAKQCGELTLRDSTSELPFEMLEVLTDEDFKHRVDTTVLVRLNL